MSSSERKNVISMQSHGQLRRGVKGSPEARVLREAVRLASDLLRTIIARMMDKVDDALFERAEKAESHALQIRYFDAMRELRIVRGDIEETFVALFTAAFTDGIPRNGPQRQREIGRRGGNHALARGDNDQLEEELAIGGMVNKIRGKCSDNLHALDRRIGFLIQDPDLEHWCNPLGPDAICDAFRRAASQIRAGLEIRLVIFKLFDQHLSNQTDSLYTAINHYLIRMGVLPDLRAIAHSPPLPTQPLDREARALPVTGPASGPGEYSDTASDFSHVPMAPGIQPCYRTMAQVPDAASVSLAKGILPCYRHAPRFPDAASVPMAPGIEPSRGVCTPMPLSVSETDRTLEREDSGVDTDRSDMTQEVHGAGPKARCGMDGEPRRTGAQGHKTIDLVALLFDYLLDDQHIPGTMRALIGRMQAPILKVALLDPEFFAKTTHPARVLLNRLASAAKGWDQSAGIRDPLYRQLEATIKAVHERFEGDMRLFAELRNDLDAFLQRTEDDGERLAGSSVKVLQEKVRLDAAQSSTMDEIQPRIEGEDNLCFVREFIATHWKRLLFVTCAREGKDSEAWSQAVSTMDDLIWSVKSGHMPEERERLAALQPRLLRNLRQGMERLSVPPTERDEFIAKLARA
ncbi:MAG: DUF1631 family protein, partial [Gammaproteobacteria bacterium]